MVRLSKQVTFKVQEDVISRDLDATPNLYVYRDNITDPVNKLLIQGDTANSKPNTRNFSFAPFWENVMLGTDNFYPEEGLGFDNYHNEAKLQNILGDSILPTLNYKKGTLYFSQGSLSDSSILGYTFKMYCYTQNNEKLYLLSSIDFKNNSNVTAKNPKFFESQIFNEGIDFEFLDVSYLLNSNDQEVNEIKNYLFGDYRPDRIYIEYAPITEESIDEFMENSYNFTSLNTLNINTQSIPTSFVENGSEIYNELKLTNNNRVVTSNLKHDTFSVSNFLDSKKQSNEFYKIVHSFVVNNYNSNDELIETYGQNIENAVDVYENVNFRPIVDINTDHSKIDCSVNIENVQTGLTYTVYSSIVITNENISKFKTTPDVDISGLSINKVSNTVNRTVNKIYQKNETPEIITLEKKLYVHTQQPEEIVLLDGDFTAELNFPSNDFVDGNPDLFLKIGNLKIKNTDEDPLFFNIPKEAYKNQQPGTYSVLDGDGKIMGEGKLSKKDYTQNPNTNNDSESNQSGNQNFDLSSQFKTAKSQTQLSDKAEKPFVYNKKLNNSILKNKVSFDQNIKKINKKSLSKSNLSFGYIESDNKKG